MMTMKRKCCRNTVAFSLLGLTLAIGCGILCLHVQQQPSLQQGSLELEGDGHLHLHHTIDSVLPTLIFQVHKYNAITSSNDDEKVLNVHIVPHTHDDVGWLKTVEQYYEGWNNSIQQVCVDDILTSVMEALVDNPTRTFTYVEQKFFTMWWDRQSPAIQETVQRLVASRQLTFVNGGWCMHDEATTHYMGMIDQTTLGHDFLKRTFNVIPKVGWQLDPFGHSATQASVMSYKMGFDALYFGRIDYQDLGKRQLTGECEGFWNASTSWKDSTVFWGLTGSYGGNYGPPAGFCFDPVSCKDPELIGMNRTTLSYKVEDFLEQIREQSDRTKGNHIMLTMGSDFQYQRASFNFANTDFLLATIQRMQEYKQIDIPAIFGPRFNKVNIFYSSPDYYTQCKYNETVELRQRSKRQNGDDEDEHRYDGSSFRRTMKESPSFASDLNGTNDNYVDGEINYDVNWSVKQDDFFPYSDCPHCFWTGYFTSRPALKRLERVSSSFLMAARQIDSMVDHSVKVDADQLQCKDPIHQLEDASGVIQHHDGVSGTSKQHVAYDYAKRVQAGINAVVPCMIRKMKRLLMGNKTESPKNYLQDFSYCQLLNETKCDVSVSATEKGDDLYVAIYNSLPWERSVFVDLPVAKYGLYLVEHIGTDALVGAKPEIVAVHSAQNTDVKLLQFRIDDIPPLGAKVFRIQYHSSTLNQTLSVNLNEDVEANNRVEVSNGKFSVQIDTRTGNIVNIGSHEVENLFSWGYYTSYDYRRDMMHDNDYQNSGAYIFRPSTPNQELTTIPVIDSQITHTNVGVEVTYKYQEPWIKTTTRIFKGAPYVEIEYQIGPIPANDRRGREVVVRYITSVDNAATFYTDSNGREFLKRRRNYRPTWNMTVYQPVAGNYYPVNTAIYVEKAVDSNANDGAFAFAVVTDRTQGGASLVDGTVELMVHRRTLADDSRGVSEPINETDIGITPNPPWGHATRVGNGLVIKGKHRILVSNGNTVGGASLARSVMDEVFAEPLVFAGSGPPEEPVPFSATSFSGLTAPFPKNVMLITKKILYEDSTSSAMIYLVRLGHQYGIEEDRIASQPVKVNLEYIFPEQTITKVLEMTLSGNRELSEWYKERFDWTKANERFDGIDPASGFIVTLNAMEIRTFHVIVAVSM